MSPLGLRVPVGIAANNPKGRPMKKLVRPVRKVNADVVGMDVHQRQITFTQLDDDVFVVSHRVKVIGLRGKAMKLVYTKTASLCVAAGFSHMKILEQESETGQADDSANASIRAQFYFEDVRVPVANTIGDIGRGFQQQMMQFQDERLVACVSSIASMVLLWEQTKTWAEERMLFGKPLSKMQNTQFKMTELWIDLVAAQELIRACVQQRVDGEDATAKITMAKVFCARVGRQAADECIQLHGGYGYMKESAAGRAFVDTRLASIGGGSDETMLHYLAKQLGF